MVCFHWRNCIINSREGVCQAFATLPFKVREILQITSPELFITSSSTFPHIFSPPFLLFLYFCCFFFFFFSRQSPPIPQKNINKFPAFSEISDLESIFIITVILWPTTRISATEKKQNSKCCGKNRDMWEEISVLLWIMPLPFLLYQKRLFKNQPRDTREKQERRRMYNSSC